MENLLELKNIVKKYPGVVALKDVSFNVRKGEVHAIVGENGAGKSTLIKIISGAITPTSGKIKFEDTEYDEMTPAGSRDKGIRVVYQEFNLVPQLSVYHNVTLGEKTGNSKIIRDDKLALEQTINLFEKLKIKIDPKELVENITTGQMQLTEIAKAVLTKSKLLIMDEPSASLSTVEVENMFEIVEQLRREGVSILYISHRLDEIFRIADRVTVLRDGNYITTKNINEVNRDQLIALMVGRELSETYPPRKKPIENEVVFKAENLTGNGVHDISFQIRKGEILGMAGLVGAGRTETAKLIYGDARLNSGNIQVFGKNIRINSPVKALQEGISLIPEDRKLEGFVGPFSIFDNISLVISKKYSKATLIDKKQIGKIVNEYFERLRIKAPDTSTPVDSLSGGNQQKVVLAKVLASQCNIIIFDEPTRGIDVGARKEIYDLMRELSDEGISILMITSDMEELLGMSDRIVVLHEGRMAGEIQRDEFTQERVLELASGL